MVCGVQLYLMNTRPDKNSDWLLFDSKSNSVWNSSVAPIGKGNEMPSLPSKFIRSIENLLLDHPNGIERAKFLEAYKAKYKEDFPLIDFGFENLMALLGHLAKRNVVHLKFSGYTPIVCMPFCFSSQDDMFVGLRKDDDFINALYPMDVVKYNEVIPLQELPEDLAPGYSFDIQVAEVESPSLFWFQIWEKNLQEEFEAMMDEMQVFYNGNGPSVHKMPEAIIMIGQYCAAKYPSASAPDAEWHRAIISSLPSLHEAEVYYIDYGSKLKLQYSEIYFLDSRFSKLPCQAHRGCLTNIRPIGYGLWKKLKHMPESNDICTVKPTWTKTCFYYFLSLVSNKPMVATVTHIRKLDNFLSMGLTDTNEEEDRHINDLLVTAKLAEFGVMSEEDEFPCFSPHRHESEHSSPGGSSSPMPLQRPIMAGNGYDKSSHYSTSSLKPSSSSASPATSACADNENGGSGVTSIPTISNGEEHLRDQSLTRAQREEEQLRLQALQEKLEGTILLEEAKRLEQEKKMEEVRKKLEIHQQCVELKKLEEVRWLEDQRQLDEQRRLEEQRWLEEQRRLKEQRLLEEQRQLEEQRWLGECRWLEEQRQLEKQRWLEEQRLLNEKKQMEEKAKQEAQLRFELQKLLIQEKLLSIQKQQFQAQLLFLSAQNSMSAIMPIGINSLLGSQPTLQPEMLNMMTKVNPPPGLPQLMAGGMPNNSLPSGGINPFQNLASLGNFSFQNQSIPLWNEVGNNLGGFLTSDFGGSGDNIAPKHTLYVPPGFKHLDNVTTPSQVPSAAKTPLSSNPGLVSNGIAISESGKLVVRPDSKLDNTEEPMTTDDNCSNKDPSRTAKFNSLPQVFGVGSSEAGSLEVSVNISKSSDSHPRKSEDVVNPVDGPGTVLSQSKKGRDGDEPSYISEPVVINPWSVQNSFVSSHVPQPKNYSPECSSIKGKSSGKAISPKALGVLNSLLESCKVHDKHTPSVAKEDASQKYLQAGERKVECDAQEKWKITIETPNSEDDSMDFMKGCLNGRAVNVIDVKGTKCVLTEEIMTLFFKNLPVHVALKIAELRPNGHKIKSLTINPLKERTLCQKISRLKIIEINPKGSDIYFTTVETLHYLCSALDGPK
ncbi:uncharacterized protein [Hetaerina americana]|uniref:uncharacterized protein isoform X2 n=1 Tax=Hetaerina americana TaxID=62018 RepID=UPI003A7F391F